MKAHVQIGKQGITESFIESLKNFFKKNKNMRISVLKSARENKEQVKKYSKEILEKLGENYTAKIIGFTIILKKWRQSRKQIHHPK
jgi:RNA-binding protein YhbY